jgi:hypothetical protein
MIKTFKNFFDEVVYDRFWPTFAMDAVALVSGEHHRPVAKSLTNFITQWYRVHLPWTGFELTTLVVIGTDCIDSCKSNYHMITTRCQGWICSLVQFFFLFEGTNVPSLIVSLCHILSVIQTNND